MVERRRAIKAAKQAAPEVVAGTDPRVRLTGAALDLYDHLDALGEIERLRRMPRLAMPSPSDPPPGLSFWDFTASCLQLSALAPSLAGGDLRIEGHRVGSGRELAQCWALLAAYGHLWTGVAGEPLIMDVLARGRARDVFMQGLPTDAERGYAAWVIDYRMPYRVHAPLASGFLNVLPEHRRAAGRASWLAMLRAYCEPGLYPDEIWRVDRVYRRLRRLAHLDLDLSCAGVPLTLNISSAEWDAARYLAEASEPDSGPLVALVNGLSFLLHTEFHVAPGVALLERLLEDRAGPWLREVLKAAKSPEDSMSTLHALKAPDACPAITEAVEAVARQEYIHLFRVRQPRGRCVLAKVFSAQSPRVQSRMQREVGADALVSVLSHVLGPHGDHATERLMDFYIRPGIAPADMARTLAALCARMTSRTHGHERSRAPGPWHDPEVRALAARLFVLMLPEGERVRLKETPLGDIRTALVRACAADAVESELALQLSKCRSSSRGHELEVLARSLGARPIQEFRMVLFSGFVVERRAQDSPGDAEFDGAYMDVDARSATLYLIEAKSTLDSPAAARQLRRRLRRLGWMEGSQVVAIEGGAEAAIPVWPRGRR